MWCLFPRNEKFRWAVFMGVSKDRFVAMVKEGYAKFREQCAGIFRQVNDSRGNLRILNRPYYESAYCLAQRRQAKAITVSAGAVWPTSFDRTVSLALTVDALSAWLIKQCGDPFAFTDMCVFVGVAFNVICKIKKLVKLLC